MAIGTEVFHSSGEPVVDKANDRSEALSICFERLVIGLTGREITAPVALSGLHRVRHPQGPFFTQKELTADEVLRLYQLGRRMLAL